MKRNLGNEAPKSQQVELIMSVVEAENKADLQEPFQPPPDHPPPSQAENTLPTRSLRRCARLLRAWRENQEIGSAPATGVQRGSPEQGAFGQNGVWAPGAIKTEPGSTIRTS